MSPERLSSPNQEEVLTPKMSVPTMPLPVIPAKEGESALTFLLAVAQSQTSRTTDDDLTSLSWLHEKDVLKGINLVNQSPANSVNTTPSKVTFVQNPSPTSDYTDESSSVSPTDSMTSSLNSPIPYQPLQQKNKHPYNVPYDPVLHVKNKPPYSFSCLIFMAIENSDTKALPVKDIYAWILDHFPYFYNAPTGWKNSVRHNLSLNKCFQKVEKAPNLGKGSLWTVDPKFRPNLMQALTRSFHPSYTLDPNSHFKWGRNSNSELFPYLIQPTQEQSDDSLEAVDAAAVMLSLKNGPRYRFRKDKSSQFIINSPTGDHTYASENALNSNDEAVESDEERNSKTNACRKIDFEDEEEQRRIKEGAETLLNLAGISTRRRSREQNLDNYYNKRRKSNQFTIPVQTYEKPQQFRPRLLRAKKKEKVSHNINNNNSSSVHDLKVAEIEDEWVRHRRELEDEQKR